MRIRMTYSSRKCGRFRKGIAGLALAIVMVAVSGCQTLSYYAQAAGGQYELLAHKQPIAKLLADPATPAPLRTQLQLLTNLLAFARSDLKLPVDNQYRKYVDVHRPFVVWNVEAAPEFSLEPKSWWYPLVGSMEYRGYFSETDARKYADHLRANGYDVFLGGVEAYSTLGWFKDPVLNTFVFDSDADLAELIFHELGHQQLFVRGDENFNEAFATCVGQEGARRWLRAKGDRAAMDDYEAELGRTVQFANLIAAARKKLMALYGDEVTEDGRVQAIDKNRAVPAEQLRREKQRILDELQRDYASLKAQWGGNSDYDHWFTKVNNAKLNSVAAYYDLVPGFNRILAGNGGDLSRFFQATERLSHRPKKERDHLLMTKSGAESGPAAPGERPLPASRMVSP
jgi:predicted aminopeptidase